MQRIFSVKLFTVVVVALTSSNALEGLNDQNFDCDSSRYSKCKPEAINVIKDSNSKFVMCPNSNRLCQEVDTKICLNESRLYIYDYGALNVLQGGSFLLNDNSVCEILASSFLEINKNALTRVDKGVMVLSVSGEIRSKGSVYVGQNSVLQVYQHAQILLKNGESDVVGGFIHIGDSAIVQVHIYSKVTVNANSELRAISNNKIEIKSHSTFDMGNNAELLMANGSKLRLFNKATLDIGSDSCSRPNRTRLLLGSGSDVQVYRHGTIELIVGQIKVDDRASLNVFGLSQLQVRGLLHIKDKVSVTLSDGNSIDIGSGGEWRCEYSSDNASLIITNGNAIPRKLKIYEGAHCFTNKSVESSYDFSENAIIWLDHDSETKEFKCFNSRDKLMAAVNRI